MGAAAKGGTTSRNNLALVITSYLRCSWAGRANESEAVLERAWSRTDRADAAGEHAGFHHDDVRVVSAEFQQSRAIRAMSLTAPRPSCRPHR
jgi:hypothetical protein